MERQRFSGERVTHDLLSPNPTDFLRIWRDLCVNPLGVLEVKEAHLARYKFAQKIIEKNSNSSPRILDLGCGIGYGLKYLAASNGNCFAVGIDLDTNTIKEANNVYGTECKRFCTTNTLCLPFPAKTFDLITCFEVIEHISLPEKALSECTRILSRNGILVISTPNREIASPGNTRFDKPRNIYHKFELAIEEFDCLLKRFFSKVEIFAQAQHPERISTTDSILYRLGKAGRLAINLKKFRDLRKFSHVATINDHTKPGYFVAVCSQPTMLY